MRLELSLGGALACARCGSHRDVPRHEGRGVGGRTCSRPRQRHLAPFCARKLAPKGGWLGRPAPPGSRPRRGGRARQGEGRATETAQQQRRGANRPPGSHLYRLWREVSFAAWPAYSKGAVRISMRLLMRTPNRAIVAFEEACCTVKYRAVSQERSGEGMELHKV